jgi:hypothetical protein
METIIHLNISRSDVLRMGSVSDKSCRENLKIFHVQKLLQKNCSVLWDNVERYDAVWQATDDKIIRLMRFACCIPKITDTYSEYVILLLFRGNNS